MDVELDRSVSVPFADRLATKAFSKRKTPMWTECDRKVCDSLCWSKMLGAWPIGALSIVFASKLRFFSCCRHTGGPVRRAKIYQLQPLRVKVPSSSFSFRARPSSGAEEQT